MNTAASSISPFDYGAQLFRQGKRTTDGRYKPTSIQFRMVCRGWRHAQIEAEQSAQQEAQQPQEAAA